MASKKFCDLCQNQVASTDTQCLKCGGTSFSWKQDSTNVSTVSEAFPKSVTRVTHSENNASSFFDSLFSLDFSKYVTQTVIKFTYALVLISSAISAIVFAITFWILFGVGANSESSLPILLFLISTAISLVVLLAILAFTRVGLEAVTALVEIAMNTRKVEKK